MSEKRRAPHPSRAKKAAARASGGRAMWSGHLTFGLVSIPVRVHAALEAGERVAFRLLHRKDHAPIMYKKFCSREDVEVPADEIVRGYEVGKGKFKVVENDELDQVQAELGEGEHTIDLMQFVEPQSLDPLLFDHAYYLVPDEGGEKAYGLLRDALRDTGRVGVARLYMRRPILAAIFPHDKLLALEAMRPFEELRAADEFPISERKASDAEKRMARALIDEMSATWDPRAHPNRYRQTLEKLLVDRPRFALGDEGEQTEKPAGRRGDVVDLMEALRRSVAGSKGKGRPAVRSARKATAGRKRGGQRLRAG